MTFALLATLCVAASPPPTPLQQLRQRSSWSLWEGLRHSKLAIEHLPWLFEAADGELSVVSDGAEEQVGYSSPSVSAGCRIRPLDAGLGLAACWLNGPPNLVPVVMLVFETHSGTLRQEEAFFGKLERPELDIFELGSPPQSFVRVASDDTCPGHIHRSWTLYRLKGDQLLPVFSVDRERWVFTSEAIRREVPWTPQVEKQYRRALQRLEVQPSPESLVVFARSQLQLLDGPDAARELRVSTRAELRSCPHQQATECTAGTLLFPLPERVERFRPTADGTYEKVE